MFNVRYIMLKTMCVYIYIYMYVNNVCIYIYDVYTPELGFPYIEGTKKSKDQLKVVPGWAPKNGCRVLCRDLIHKASVCHPRRRENARLASEQCSKHIKSSVSPCLLVDHSEFYCISISYH